MATTWTTPDALVSKCVDTTGTGSAPTAATDGISLTNLGSKNGFTVIYESTASTFAACTLLAYLYASELSSGAGAWVRAPDLDLSVQALTAQGFTGFRVVSPRGRIAYVPSGSGQSGIIWITGSASQY